MLARWWVRFGWVIALLIFAGGAAVASLGQTAVHSPSQAAPPQAEPAQAEPELAKPAVLLPQVPPVSPEDHNAAPVARPGEVYQQALKPLDLVRSSLDNWSDAELGALTAGMRMAREACGKISIGMVSGQDLYDLIRLCAFGQDWTRSNTAAVKYIASGEEPHRAQAYAMSLNALTHMADTEDAVKTAQEMLRTLPYDGEVAYALRYFVIYLTHSSDPAALALATQEHAAIVEALQTGLPLKAVHGDAVMGVGELFDSGLRLAFLQRYAGDGRGAERTYADLDGALTKAGAISATDYQLISAAETQYKLLGTRLPEIEAQRVLTAPMTKTKVGSDPGYVTVFAIFPDWCPQCAKAMQGLSEFAAQHVAAKVHAVGLMVQDSKPDTDAKLEAGSKPEATPDYKILKGTATVSVTKEAAEVFSPVEYPLIVVTDPEGIVYFVGLIPDNAFVPNGYMEQVIGRIVGERAVVRNASAGKTKAAPKKQ